LKFTGNLFVLHCDKQASQQPDLTQPPMIAISIPYFLASAKQSIRTKQVFHACHLRYIR